MNGRTVEFSGKEQLYSYGERSRQRQTHSVSYKKITNHPGWPALMNRRQAEFRGE
jgi:hypothetical protein